MWESRSLPAPLQPQGRFFTETALRRFCAPVFISTYAADTSKRIVLRRGHGGCCASLQLPRRRVATRGCLDAVCAARVSGGLPAASGGGSYWHVAAQGRFFTETALRRFCARISHLAIPPTRRTALSGADANGGRCASLPRQRSVRCGLRSGGPCGCALPVRALQGESAACWGREFMFCFSSRSFLH